MAVDGFRFRVGVLGPLTSAEALLDDACEVDADAWRLPSTSRLLDRVPSREGRLRFGDADASGDNDGKDVKTLGDPGFASVLVRPLDAAAPDICDVERLPRTTPFGSIVLRYDAGVYLIICSAK